MFGKSKIDKLKDILADLTEEELTEAKKLLIGEEKAEEKEETVETEEEAPNAEEEVKTDEEVKTEDTPAEEAQEESETEEVVETEEKTEEKSEETGEEETTEEVEEEEPEEDENAKQLAALQARFDELQEKFGKFIERVEPVLAKFEEVESSTEAVGLGKGDTTGSEEGLSAHELAMKLARY